MFYSVAPRRFGFYGQPSHTTWSKQPVPVPIAGEFDYVEHPLVLDPLPAAPVLRWIAPFAVYGAIICVPVLRIDMGLVHPDSGRLIPRSLKGYPVLSIGQDHVYSGKILANNQSLIVTGVPLLDYVIVAPVMDKFSLLPLLPFDDTPAGREWRNWVSDGRGWMQSYTGNPFGDISTVAPAWQTLDFAPHISPLATGVSGIIQAFSPSATDSACYLHVGRDTSNHTLCSVGLDRASTAGAGMSAPFRASFGNGKTLAVQVTPNTIGRITITGWQE